MPTLSSRYPETVRFAKDNPLPTTVDGMANALLDIATLLLACRGADAERWDSLSFDILLRRNACAYPGSFLSNPALLLSTASHGEPGKSFASLGSYGPGCFFDYSHYQEDSLGPALLLSAFSPRTQRCARPARLYAQALLSLASKGMIHSGTASGSAELAMLASGKTSSTAIPSARFSMVIHREHRSHLDHLRTDLAACAASLALQDDKQGLFSRESRERLSALISERKARSEAVAIGNHVKTRASSSLRRSRAPRV